MNKISVLLLSSLVFVSGCTIGDGGNDTVSNEFPPPTPSEPEVVEGEPGTQDGQVPTVGVAGGLIGSTDPQARLQQIRQGKNDPFSVTAPQAIIQYQSSSDFSSAENGFIDGNGSGEFARANGGVNGQQTQQANGGVNGQQAQQANGGVTGQQTQQANGGVNGQQTQQANGGVRFAPDGTPLPPGDGSMMTQIPEPDPLFAEEILISGIVDVGGEKIAIISTPESSSVRSVRVGDFIAGGRDSVVVRGIDIFRPAGQSVSLMENNYSVERNLGNLKGTITFEERGERIIKRVGEINTNVPK